MTTATTFLLGRADGHLVHAYRDNNDGPVAISDHNLLMNTNQGFVAINPINLEQRWSYKGGEILNPVIINDQLIVNTINCHYLSIRDINTGEEKFSWEKPDSGGGNNCRLIVADNWVYTTIGDAFRAFKGQ